MSQVTGINSFAENPPKGLKIILSQIEGRLIQKPVNICVYIYSCYI